MTVRINRIKKRELVAATRQVAQGIFNSNTVIASVDKPSLARCGLGYAAYVFTELKIIALSASLGE